MATIHTLTLLPSTRSNIIPFQGLGFSLNDAKSVDYAYKTSTTQVAEPSSAVSKDFYEEIFRQQSAQLETFMAAVENFMSTTRALQHENVKFWQTHTYPHPHTSTYQSNHIHLPTSIHLYSILHLYCTLHLYSILHL